MDDSPDFSALQGVEIADIGHVIDYFS